MYWQILVYQEISATACMLSGLDIRIVYILVFGVHGLPSCFQSQSLVDESKDLFLTLGLLKETKCWIRMSEVKTRTSPAQFFHLDEHFSFLKCVQCPLTMPFSQGDFCFKAMIDTTWREYRHDKLCENILGAQRWVWFEIIDRSQEKNHEYC